MSASPALHTRRDSSKSEVDGTTSSQSPPLRWLPANECLEEVARGIGPEWRGLPLYGATRDGRAPAKERIGKHPERYKPVEPGTVFYNPMRILLGSIAMLDEGEHRGITSPDYVVVRGRPGVLHHRVFYYWLRSLAGEQLIRDLARGGVRERILFKRLCTGQIPVPPWSTQVRLAEQLALVPVVRKAALDRLAAAEALAASFLRDAFAGAREWEPRPLGDLVEGNGQYGTSQRSNTHGRGLPVLGMPHIHEGRIRWRNLAHVDLCPDEFAKYRLVAGDILFNRTNSAELVGKTAVFDGAHEAVFASYLIRYRVKPAIADPHFISAYINSRQGREYIERHMARAVGQVNISASTMHRMPVPCPSLSVQHSLAARLSRHRAASEHVITRCGEELAAIEALISALLREVFGESQHEGE